MFCEKPSFFLGDFAESFFGVKNAKLLLLKRKVKFDISKRYRYLEKNHEKNTFFFEVSIVLFFPKKMFSFEKDVKFNTYELRVRSERTCFFRGLRGRHCPCTFSCTRFYALKFLLLFHAQLFAFFSVRLSLAKKRTR